MNGLDPTRKQELVTYLDDLSARHLNQLTNPAPEPPDEIRDLLDRQAMLELDADINATPLVIPNIKYIMAKCSNCQGTFICGDDSFPPELAVIYYASAARTVTTECPFCTTTVIILQLP